MPTCKHCNYEFDHLCLCKCGKCEPSLEDGLRLRSGKLAKKRTGTNVRDSGVIPSCEGSATGLGGIKIRSSITEKDGFCNFCGGPKSEPTIHVIEGGRAKFVLCRQCFAIIRNQWNQAVMDPKERWME